MSLEAGRIVTLPIGREVSPYGFFLLDGEQEVLMHYSELIGKVKVGDRVEVFIFHDTEDRLAATMKKPLLTLGELGKLKIADLHPRLGAFLEMGLGRQLLLPMSELPEKPELRPHIGDDVYVVMQHDRQGRLLARLAGEEEFSPLVFHAPSTWMNEWVDALVYKPLQMGTFVLVDGGVLGFGALGLIHQNERSRMLRLGERVKVRVTQVREEDGRLNLSMIQRKEIGRDEDSQRLLSFMLDRPDHAMPYSDRTPPDVIKQRFGISKAAFKRALGKLMKEGVVVQDQNWTRMVDKNAPAAESSPESQQ
ncbi:S1 RNA-binding domain-containing protein [Paenibacillus bovis]|uniref:RNA-binding protein n=1 Tax=Paenibacillus bovis TaxID=1616788 RepID=A0A172ZKJ1_9BACL|nr:S1-like domain-containing RNA-binding protein [Paenibacillus bovis]ANF97777.1 RNA-binding protein [Paenibacillus bovis]